MYNFITHSLQNLQDLANQQYSARTAILTSNTEQLLNLIEREYNVSHFTMTIDSNLPPLYLTEIYATVQSYSQREVDVFLKQ